MHYSNCLCNVFSTAVLKVSEKPITAIALLSLHTIVYATGDNHVSYAIPSLDSGFMCNKLQVCIYDASKSKVLYDIKLTHSVLTLDVWNEKYILVGSSPVQLFEMKTDHNAKTERLRRIVVVDPKDTSQLMVLV